MGKHFHEMEPGELSGPGRELVQPLIDNAVKHHCDLYALSGDQVHLWRAWRAARARGELSPVCLALLLPHLDHLAAQPVNTLRADQHSRRNDLLLDYYDEVDRMKEQREGCAKSLAQIRREVAARHNTSEGAIKQAVMEFEGRGQRGKNR